MTTDYSSQSIASLLRGPLISTPQGWVVVASAVLYAVLALALTVFGLSPPLGKSLGWALGLCIAWPFIVFLMFIKIGLPSFAPSWNRAAFLTVCAAAPMLGAAWRAYS
jgi:hypothetical protein